MRASMDRPFADNVVFGGFVDVGFLGFLKKRIWVWICQIIWICTKNLVFVYKHSSNSADNYKMKDSYS
jgi:hypothetical protein